MANGTTLSDVIVPTLFNPYVVNRTMALSALFQSGIAVNNAEFDALASEAAPIHNMPFFEDLTGASEDVIEGHALQQRKSHQRMMYLLLLERPICGLQQIYLLHCPE